MAKYKGFAIGLLLTLLVFVVAAAQGSTYTVNLRIGESALVTCESGGDLAATLKFGVGALIVCEPSQAPTATAVPPTATAVPPTATAVPPTPTAAPPTATAVPPTPTAAPPTATAVPGGSQSPYAGAPLCSTHDPTRYHGLWNAANGCHYDHEHGTDPKGMDYVFGQWGAAWGGQEISYPWQTYHTMDGVTHYENDTKHGGYKFWSGWLTYSNDDNLNWTMAQSRVVAARYLHHAKGSSDPSVRNHSFYAELLVCPKNAISGPDAKGFYAPEKINLGQCGIVRGGGWDDYGYAHAPYKTKFVKTDASGALEHGLPWPPTQSIHEDPYRAARPCSEGPDKWLNSWAQCKTCGQVSDLGRDNWQLWTTAPSAFNTHIGLHVIRFDAPTCFIESGGIATEQRVTGNNTRFNNTEHSPFRLYFYVDPAWDGSSIDADGQRNGRVTFSGHTSVNGRPVNCSGPGADCVPYQLQNAPVGWGGWVVPSDNGKDLRLIKDGDISPANDWWINPEVN